MDYALPEPLTRNYPSALRARLSIQQQKDGGFGSRWWVFPWFFRSQRTTSRLTSRDSAEISHRKWHRAGHHQRPDMWLWWLPRQGPYQAVARLLGQWLNAGQT